MRRKIAAVLAVTLGCAVLVSRGMDPVQVAAALSAFDLSVLGPVLGLLLAVLLLRTQRFRWLLAEPVGFRDMLSVVAVSFLAINVVPLRMGELVRPYLLAEAHRVPFGSAVAAVVAERMMDLLAMLVLLLGVALFVDLPAGGLVVGGLDVVGAGTRAVGGMVAVGLVGIVALVAIGGAAVDVVAGLVSRVSPGLGARVGALGGRFVEALRDMGRHPARTAGAAACTALMWALTLLTVGLMLAGFGLPATLELSAFNWAATITGVTLVPTPGYFGPFEAGSAGSLALMGVAPDTARAFGLAMHGVMFGSIVAFGGLFLVREGWSLASVVRESRRAGAG